MVFFRARDLLAHSSLLIQEVLQGQDLTLEFSHLASFGSRVLYVDVNTESNILLKKIAGLLMGIKYSRFRIQFICM